MCDICADFLDLLQSYEEKVSRESEKRPLLKKYEVEIVYLFIQSWASRQCMCCFRDSKNYERFNLLTQSIIYLAVCKLVELKEEISVAKPSDNNKTENNKEIEKNKEEEKKAAEVEEEEKKDDLEKKNEDNFKENNEEKEDEERGEEKEIWTIQEKENLLQFLSKVFLLNFPLYVACKHSGHLKLDELSQEEVSTLSAYCDLHDYEIPVYILRNVCLFCKHGGVHAMTLCFDKQSPDTLPVSVAHAIIAIVCNLKLWLNFRSIMQLFVPLRTKVLKYMCSLADKDLRLAGIKNMADFIWSAVKDPLDSPLTFDRDGLDLAFKYFSSSTLTMRLAGIAQINSHINMFNELCTNESIIEVENVGQNLANWLIDNNIISHIFGPNLHVEVIKQSHIILSFLAMENKITNEHIDIIWQAAQLKHCSKQVHDLLPPLIKNLEAGPVLHLYSLLSKLEPKDHTEQSLYLASSLIKFIWNNGGSYSQLTTAQAAAASAGTLAGMAGAGMVMAMSGAPFIGLGKAAAAAASLVGLKQRHRLASSSENSASIEPSDDEQAESSQPSEGHKSSSELSYGPPTKRIRKLKKKHKMIVDDSSEGSVKIEDLDVEEAEEEDEEEEEEKDDEEEEDDEDDEHENENDDDVKTAKSRSKSGQSKFIIHKSFHHNTICRKGTGVCHRGSSSEAEDTDVISPPPKKKSKCLRKRKKSHCKSLQGKLKLKMNNEPRIDCSDDDEPESCSDDEHRKDKSGNQSKGEQTDLCFKSLEADQEVPSMLVRDGPPAFIQLLEERSQGGVVGGASSPDSPHGEVMTELASLVQGTDYRDRRIHECSRPFLNNLQMHREMIEEMQMMSGEEGSYSSRMSNKSEKNMADFDGEESGCEDELVQLAAQAQVQAHLSPHTIPQHLNNIAFHSRFHSTKLTRGSGHEVSRIFAHFKMENVCKPGSTLLWDLLQDDKIVHLGEGLAIEAEKALCNLLCFNTERVIRMKFIEGCLENLANNRSVVISLRLLPKLLASFQQFRGMDTHQITTWAECEHHMMHCFFNNLQTYTKHGPKTALYSHQTEIQVRLQFLTSIFSPVGSPDSFRLSLDQVDILWSCLATDPQCSDELFSWLLSQAKSKEQHALGMDALKHLYMRKLPTLEPETISMTCLGLFQQLCNLARMATAHLDKELDVLGMSHLWRIALRANNTDVSMAAIQYLNSYYIGRQLDHESEFVSQCMGHLAAASKDLASAEEPSLLCIQRALLLLKTHLETFRRRYAYHLRRWTLEGHGVGSHVQLMNGDRGCVPIKVMIQPTGFPEKIPLELLSTDYVADLRAEVVKCWETIQLNKASVSASEESGPVAVEGPIRMITQGQELTTEYDEKTLSEMGFKDLHTVYISLGASRQSKSGKHQQEAASSLPPPPKESLPTLLLLQPDYFEQLFELMQTLGSMRTPVKGGHHIPHTKAQVLSRRVWDILTLLPTSPTLLRGFQQLASSADNMKLSQFLDPTSPQKLMYSLYIVESLSRPSKRHKLMMSGGGDSSDKDGHSWSQMFVQHGGLRHLFDIFMSGVLQRSGSDGSEWQQDCLATLLKLLHQLGVTSDEAEIMPDSTEFFRNKRGRRLRKGSSDKLAVPKLNDAMLKMMKINTVMPRLTSILQEASLPRDPNHYKTGFWGRAQVVHYAMSLLVSWVHSKEEVRQVLFSGNHLTPWLQRLILEDPEPAVRREVCTALYRLCLGTPQAVHALAGLMLVHLMDYLSVAESMRPQKIEAEDGKEPYGPACRDYFWLLCRLVDSLPSELVKESIEDPTANCLDIDGLAKKIASSILSRDYLETRHNTIEDDGLIGLLNLMSNVIKHGPPFKTSKEGQEFLLQVFEFLFALPNPRKRYVPKCKSQLSRSSAYDLLGDMVKGSLDNYIILHERLLSQHQPGPHSPYPWDYWPHEDGRSDCGYVGLTNLGATCYMASCMQHLYMMPQARTSILRAKCDSESKHEHTLRELQRMFAYLLESERKAYNPRSFCKVYTMDHQPLNTGEQKDMAEFFIDLVSKLEEMTPELKKLVKTLFGGVLSNNVVSLDCEHVSRTLEEFYTVRCQVADMRNLYESLDEVTVKDTLEGDNMYTCSQCGKKVRAEKRACFKKLPHILCFNTMRYTFNMVTMLKEKVNTHFSFPLRLDMSGYVEKHLMPHRYQEEKRKSQLRKSEQKEENNGSLKNVQEEEITNSQETPTEEEQRECSDSEDFNERYEYDLIGVTVHTGTADGGHYYSFIRDRTTTNRDKWFLFNDAEVKPFDPNQIAAECFGGEMTSKTYDSVTDKFMDFSFEKTNSAYMLFYEWCSRDGEQRGDLKLGSSEPINEPLPNVSKAAAPASTPTTPPPPFELSKELEDWIWQDNMHFLRDKNIFEHSYFNFMWQVCGYIPQTLISQHHDITQMAAQLSTSFFMETFIHAKEKPTMVQWVELLTKQFNTSQAACEWFLDHMAHNDWWPVQILIKCPNQMVRQMFQRLCIHVIQQLRSSHAPLYLKGEAEDDEPDSDKIGCQSCVTQFVRMLLRLMEHGAKAHLKHLTEYFGFLNEFSKMGEEECQFLISVNAISAMVNFYLGQKSQDYVEVVSEEDEEEDIIPVTSDKYKPASLEKMITLIAVLVEKSRGSEHILQLSPKDYNSVASGKGLPFLYQQIKDGINLHQTRNLIFTLTRWNDRVGYHIVNMILQAMSKQQTENCQPFFKILTLLTEPATANGPGLPCFSQMVLQNIWEVAEYWPQNALDWLAMQVPRNKFAHHWVLQSMDRWMEHYLIAHANQRVRSMATQLLVSLVPSPQFRNGYRNTRSLTSPQKEMTPGSEAQHMLHQILGMLLRLLKAARHYTDIQTHGTSKLTAYFAVLTYCTISRTEKLMFGQYFLDLWQLFHPKLSEPSIPFHHNKQALLLYWHHVCVDCPENVQLILQNPHVTKNIAFNYILADHEDQEVVMFNRGMLPAYYGLLRLCCLQSRTFTRQLANHQNLHWAFKNITTYPSQYSAAVDELFKLIRLFLVKFPDSTEQEIHEINTFRRQTLQLYLQVLDGRTSWATLILAFRTLIENDEDRLYVIYNGGLQMAFEAFHTLHMMHHEASTCQVYGDLLDLLSIILDMIKSLRMFRESKDVRALLMASKEWVEILRKLATLLNTYNPPDMRSLAIDLLKEMLLLLPNEVIQVLVPLLSHCHAAFQESHNTIPMGPYFPRPMGIKNTHSARPARPLVQMAVPHGQLEFSKGNDEEYDQALLDFYTPYHEFIDVMCRLAINNDCMSEALINLSAMVGFEGVPLHLTFFPKLWVDIYNVQNVDKKYTAMLTTSNYFVDYAEAVLLDERTSLNTDIIFNFLCLYFPKVASHVLTEQTCNLIDNLVSSLSEIAGSVDILQMAYKMNGDLRALSLVYRSECPLVPPKSLQPALLQLLNKTKETRQLHMPAERASTPTASSSDSPVDVESEEPTAETSSGRGGDADADGEGDGVGDGDQREREAAESPTPKNNISNNNNNNNNNKSKAEASSSSTAATATAAGSSASSTASSSGGGRCSPGCSKDSDGDDVPSTPAPVRNGAKDHRITKTRGPRGGIGAGAGVRWLQPLEATLADLIAVIESKG